MKKWLLVFIALCVIEIGVAQTAYTFTGNGFWSVSSNWSGSIIPPSVLPAGSTIYISPAPGDSCVLNVIQTISPGANLVISAGAKFIVTGSVNTSASVPIIITNPVSSIRSFDAVSGGNIISDGGSTVYNRGMVWGTSPNPTLYSFTNIYEQNGNGTGSFVSNIGGLSSSTTYYVRAYATNGTGTGYGNEISFTTPPISSVVICNQEWMAANLDVVTYRNGDTIPQATSQEQWDTSTKGAWCYFGFQPFNYSAGKFYNAAAINDPRGLAPAGWHIPCDSEWVALTNCLGGMYEAGLKLSDTGTHYWKAAFSGVTNSSGFTALAAGRYTTAICEPTFNNSACGWYYSHYERMTPGGPTGWAWVWDPTYKNTAAWWSTTEKSSGNYMYWQLLNTYMYRINSSPNDAYSVRCVKGDVNLICNAGPPSVITDSITPVGHNYASFWGTVPNSSLKYISERGFVWDTVANPSVLKNKIKVDSGIGQFTTALKGLSASKKYYIRAYAVNAAGIGYGNEITFTTKDAILPSVLTWFISNENTSAVSGGRITDNGGDSIIAKGVVWGTGHNPTTANNLTSDGAGIQTYKSNIAGLVAATTYYIRAYAVNSAGIVYGNEVEINTGKKTPSSAVICDKLWMQKNLDVSKYRNGDPIPQVTDPVDWANMTTGAWCWYDNDSVTYAATYGKLYNWYAGNDPRGLAPEGWHVPNSSEWGSLINCLGNFNYLDISDASGVLRDTGQAYWDAPNGGATNSSGFTALPGGRRVEVFNNEGKSAGFWGTGSFLYNNQLYGQSREIMSNVFSYSSLAWTGFSVRCVRDSDFNYMLPVVSTTAVSSISGTSCTTGGNVTAAGSSPVTQRGIVWNTTPEPPLFTSNNKTTDGSGTGVFTSNIAGLQTNTKYYVWAYAVNSSGISYGQQNIFTTLASTIPIITTSSISKIGNDSARSGGTISNNYEGPPITARGIVWSLQPNPTTADSKTIDGNGIGNFNSKLTALLPITTYYVRAYAVNSNGTYYGNEISFKTLDPSIAAVSICDQVWMTKNLNVNTYRNGDVIPQITDVSAWGELTTGAWCWYNNDSATYADIYGKLYNWYAVNDPRGLAPEGWHIPNDAEWNTLTDCQGGAAVAGGSLKATGTLYWVTPNTGATNSSGFRALPGGYRRGVGVANFEEIGIYGYWWSSTDYDLWAVSRSLNNNSNSVIRNTTWKKAGLSVRCVRN